MAYNDWMPEFQDLWDTMPTDYLSDRQYEAAEYFFEEGFMTYKGEATPEDIHFARDEFFRIIGFEDLQEAYDYFDWEGWREAMGY